MLKNGEKKTILCYFIVRRIVGPPSYSRCSARARAYYGRVKKYRKKICTHAASPGTRG